MTTRKRYNSNCEGTKEDKDIIYCTVRLAFLLILYFITDKKFGHQTVLFDFFRSRQFVFKNKVSSLFVETKFQSELIREH